MYRLVGPEDQTGLAADTRARGGEGVAAVEFLPGAPLPRSVNRLAFGTAFNEL